MSAPVKTVGGFSFRAATGSRKRAAEPEQEVLNKRQSLGRRSPGDASAAPLLNGSVSSASFQAEALSALRLSNGLSADSRILGLFETLFAGGITLARTSAPGLDSHAQTVKVAFMQYLGSELPKELVKAAHTASSKNPKNVANARQQRECERRIKEYEKETAQWEGLASKAATAASSSVGGTAAASVSPAVKAWAATRSKHGEKLLSNVGRATSKVLQDLDSVSEAMRAGSQAVSAATVAVQVASKEARDVALASASGRPSRGGDAKSILRSMIR